MIPWDNIDTVLLDLDGTLLDLYFDNYFWHEYLPLKWGAVQQLTLAEAKSRLTRQLKPHEGKLSWYCLDFWSEQLNIDIFELKLDLTHLIRTRPETEELLSFLRNANKRIVLVTNSHQKLLAYKLDKTGIAKYFDAIISSHEFGMPKEAAGFWEQLDNKLEVSVDSTVLIDDNPAVLRSARDYGFKYLYAISQPDSHAPPREIVEFTVIKSFATLY